MKASHTQESALKTYFLIGALVVLVLLKGFFVFVMVADQGQPSWDYRAVQDVPSQSPYAVYPALPNSQHVRGLKGE